MTAYFGCSLCIGINMKFFVNRFDMDSNCAASNKKNQPLIL